MLLLLNSHGATVAMIYSQISTHIISDVLCVGSPWWTSWSSPYQVMNELLIARGRGVPRAARLIRRSHSAVKARVDRSSFALQTFLACGETFQTHFIAKTNGRKQ